MNISCLSVFDTIVLYLFSLGFRQNKTSKDINLGINFLFCNQTIKSINQENNCQVKHWLKLSIAAALQ